MSEISTIHYYFGLRKYVFQQTNISTIIDIEHKLIIRIISSKEGF